MKRKKYQPSLTKDMYKYFYTYSDAAGAPSFVKFAMLHGITVEELISYRKKKDFARAYRECCEIRRDYLIDRALNKRFDPSFVKFLLTEDTPDETDDTLTLKLEIVE